MPKFQYRMRDFNTMKVSGGVVFASDKAHARLMLKKDNHGITQLKEDKSTLWKNLTTSNKVPIDEVITFFTILGGALEGGLTIKEALTVLKKQSKNETLQKAIEEILHNIEEGSDLSMAFGRHEHIFPHYISPMLKAGEESGRLSEVLSQIVEYMDRLNELKKGVIGIFIYPGIVTVFTIMVVIIVLLFVFPSFEPIFKQFEVNLPMPTTILLGLSKLLREDYLLIIIMFILTGSGSWMFYQSKFGREQVHLALLKIPILGAFIINVLMLRIVKTLTILLTSGIPMLESLHIIQKSVKFIPINKLVLNMRDNIVKGLPLSDPLTNSKVIPPIVSYSIAAGEKNGNLPSLLQHLSKLLDKTLTHTMKKMTAVLDPIITVVLGGLLLFIALAIYLPIFDSIIAVGQH